MPLSRRNPIVERKIIDAVYRGACDPNDFGQAIELMAGYFDSSGVVLGEIDHAVPEAQFTIGVGTIDAAMLGDYPAVAEFDPAPEKFSALQTGAATTTDRMFPAEFLRRCVFLHEFLRPRGVQGTLGAPLSSAAGRSAIVGLHQGLGQDPFDDDDIFCLEQLTPHLTRALQIRRLFIQSKMRGHALEAILNRNPAGMIGLPAEGPALFVNSAARTLAATRDGIGIDRDGRLVTTDRHAMKRLAALQLDVLRGGAGGVVRIHRPSGKPAYLVLVSPLPKTEDLLQRAQRGGILIAIHDPARTIRSDFQRIALLLNLPLGAAKVVAALLRGLDLKDHAEQERISANTVKFHLKTAFERTGVRSQVDLVRRTLLALTDLEP